MNDRQLECFFLTAECGNLVKVAESLFLSVSTISYQIKNLEEELGIVLFDRTGKSMKLTKSGSYYLDEMKKIMNVHESILYRARSIQKNELELIIGFIDEMAFEIYPKLVSSLKAKNKNIPIKAVPISCADAGMPLLYNTVDLMFTYEYSIMNAPEIDAMILEASDFYCAVNALDPLAAKERLQLDDLNDHTVFYAESAKGWISSILSQVNEGVMIHGQCVEYPSFIPMMIKERQGVSIYPCRKGLIIDSEISCIPIDCHCKVNKVLAWRKNELKPEIELLKKVTGELFHIKVS